jgi:hypothetical protein
LDLSRFDAAPLIAFTATKETDYGTEALMTWEPRIEVEDITLRSYNPGHIIIDLSGRYLPEIKAWLIAREPGLEPILSLESESIAKVLEAWACRSFQTRGARAQRDMLRQLLSAAEGLCEINSVFGIALLGVADLPFAEGFAGFVQRF